MVIESIKNISDFFVAGINYKNSDASIRGNYAISYPQYENILQKASRQGLREIFILSTCNRTEIYGFAHSGHQLIQLLCSETNGSAVEFEKSAYIKNSRSAVQHLFEVAAGLDSQILGDYEIVGQLKTAVKFAKERGFLGGFTERLVNSVLQSSKSIKNKTGLSNGTVSVSFTAVQYLKNRIPDLASKNILLVGTGKIGRNTCKYLVTNIDTPRITLINRTAEKAQKLADELGLRFAAMEELELEIASANIILVATDSMRPVILKDHLEKKGEKLILDLSIPCNVEEAAGLLPGIRLVNVDQLSILKDETLKNRQAEVPKAKVLIAEMMNEFIEWYEMRKHVPMLKELKFKLKELYNLSSYSGPVFTCNKSMEMQIQKVLNETAGRIKYQNQRGCQYILALNDFISLKN